MNRERTILWSNLPWRGQTRSCQQVPVLEGSFSARPRLPSQPSPRTRTKPWTTLAQQKKPAESTKVTWNRRSRRSDLNSLSRLKSSCSRPRLFQTCRISLINRREEWQLRHKKCKMSSHLSAKCWRKNLSSVKTMKWSRKPACKSSSDKWLNYSVQSQSKWTS